MNNQAERAAELAEMLEANGVDVDMACVLDCLASVGYRLETDAQGEALLAYTLAILGPRGVETSKDGVVVETTTVAKLWPTLNEADQREVAAAVGEAGGIDVPWSVE